MEKTEARKWLDAYIDVCLDCDGIQNEKKKLSQLCGIAEGYNHGAGNQRRRGENQCENMYL